jgi:drug/metabolite transporter (DMT)-like permease
MDHAANRRGAALMTFAMACYVLNDACVKLTTDRLPPGQVLAVRGIFAVAILLAVAVALHRLQGDWRTLLRPLVALRCALELATALASVIALALVPLALVTSLMMTAPLIISIAAMALGWERWNARRLAGTLAGLLGVLVIIRPQPGAAPLPAWGIASALLCAALLAARELATRRLPPEAPSWMVALVAAAAVCAGGGALGLAEAWPALARSDGGLLAAAAVFAALGNYALIAACRRGELSAIVPFRYSNIVWALTAGHVLWSHTPDGQALVGIAMIVTGGLLSMGRHRP